MPKFRQRVFITLTVTLAATVAGVLLGDLAGRSAIQHQLTSQLNQDVASVSREADRYLAESRLALAAMNASPYTSCSDEELVYFRALLFESRYLKDVGHVRQNNIDCSVDLGRPGTPHPLPTADFTLQDGTAIYKNPGIYQGDDDTVITILLGNSFIVFRSANVLQLGAARTHFTETVVDAPSRRVGVLRGEQLHADPAILTADGQGRSGNMLYATRCSTRGLTCVTGFIPLSQAVHDDQREMAIFILLGGVSFGVTSLFFIIIYRRSRGMEQQLRRAIRAERLRVVYQPVVDMQSKRIVGAEALVRWTDEDGFSMSPEVFIKLAEERGFIGEITRLILRMSLRDFAPTLRNTQGFRLNINISASDLADPEFLPDLARSLETAEVPTQCLGIEITERGIARQQIAMDAILQLRRRGHRVYIDDFGTGYSSLAYLRDLAIDAIKVDRAFTLAIGTEAVTVAVLPQILSMAEELNLQVVVEGIETIEQAHYFLSSGKHFLAQGWLFGRPLPADEFLRLLAEDQNHLSATPQESTPGENIPS